MEEFVTAGKIKNIGISNFNKSQIQRILDNCTIRPACLQIELHVYFQQNELVEFCHANNIAVIAYAPLGSRGIAEIYKMSGNEYVFLSTHTYDMGFQNTSCKMPVVGYNPINLDVHI